RLLDLRLLALRIDTQDLGTDLPFLPRRVHNAVGARLGVRQGRIPGSGTDRHAVIEAQLLGVVPAAIRSAGTTVGTCHADIQSTAAGQGVVRLAFGLGVVRVEAQAQAVVDLPVRVKADLVELVLLRIALLLHAEVLERRRTAGRDLADVDGGGDGATAVELDVGVALVLQPHAHRPALLGDLVG